MACFKKKSVFMVRISPRFIDESILIVSPFKTLVKNYRSMCVLTKKKKAPKDDEEATIIVKDLIERILMEDSDLGEKRPRQMDQEDFLKLLYLFNKEGIHFPSFI